MHSIILDWNPCFKKKQVPHTHVHTHHAHAYVAQHDHTPTHKHHIKVYVCTHCGRKGHLAKFYFDRINHINFANKIFGFLMMLTPVDPKRNGYQYCHLLYLM